jgi:transcriptional regulator with XRE-family HTH domain
MNKEGGQSVRTFESIWTKLEENGAAFRRAFVAAQVKRLIPFQIHALRKNRGWSQEELAKRSGLTQGVISRAEDPDYGNLTLNTAIAIAGGFDVAFVAKYVPFSELDNYVVQVSESLVGSVPSFSQQNEYLVGDLGKIPGRMTAVPETSGLGSLESVVTQEGCAGRAARQTFAQQDLVGQGI